MTYRTREDQMSASEEFTPFLPGSFVYCHPSEVETWTQSVPFGDFSLPSPPESSSDCGSADSQDMSSQTWSQASQPEEWAPVSAQDYSTYPQPSANGWINHGVPVTSQHAQSLDNTAWSSVTSGSVDQGLSPVLSHESQSTHTLTSFSEPECMLPPGLDLSFASEPSWNPSGHVGYSGAPLDIPQSEQGFVHPHKPAGKASGFATFPQAYYPVAHPSMGLGQYGPLPYAARPIYPALAPKRQLLPRTEGSMTTYPATHVQHRVLRPQLQGQHQSYASYSSVSTPAGQPQQGPQHTAAHAGLPIAPVTSGPAMASGNSGSHHVPVLTQPTPGPRISAPAPSVMDPTAQDFTDFIHFDQEDHTTPSAYTSYSSGLPMQSVPSYVPVDSKDAMPEPEDDAHVMYPAMSNMTSNSATESDEGRHRSHPLYAAEPKEDGLFHCPYKATDPNCPHKPTKLKCNYDKFIDSHLKPFRCKIESCAKQEFSSTACLLRHEREAHGMHGHGDRPHLCYYTGCERGIPGNGFPRRYNLFDHMKRVHDHKEDPRAGTRSPSVANPQDKKAAASRKRKASEPAPLESTAQRQRIMPASAPQPQGVPVSQAYAFQPQEYYQQPAYTVPAARRSPTQSRVYHHWANQRDMIERQMGSVQSPDDEAGLQRLAQHVDEFRRLSEVVRRG